MRMQESFWQRSSWLSNGALISLREQLPDGSIRMDLAEVTAKHAPTLTAQCKGGHRATIGVRFCHGTSVLHALCNVATSCQGNALLHPRGNDQVGPVAAVVLKEYCATTTDAVQLAHDFAVYKPVLEALQEERLVTPPFESTLFSETQPPVSAPVPPPVWQNDETAAAWLQSRVESMDDAQKAAFDHALSRSVALVQGPPGAIASLMLQ